MARELIDIHSHILPGVDDGAADLEMTRAMLEMALNDGTVSLVATPHLDNRYHEGPRACAAGIARITAFCTNSPALYPGCELHLTPENVQAALREPKLFTINGRGYLLVELPDPALRPAVQPPLEMLADSGLRIIIAHPERNRSLMSDPSFIAGLRRLGCLFQITAQSVTGSFGPAIRRYARTLMRDSMVEFIASDAHDLLERRPVLSTAFDVVSHEHGEATARLCFHQNPCAALHGETTQKLERKTFFFSHFRKHYAQPTPIA